MITIAGVARFISDLHLRSDRPDIAKRFSRFLADCAEQQIEALFILGDLFEYWIGDDNLDDPFNATIVAALQQLSNSGVKLFFVHGNRDFLIGPAFAVAAGLSLLPELTVLEMVQTPVDADESKVEPETTAPQIARPKDPIRATAVGDSPSKVPTSKSAHYLLLHGDTLCTDDHAYQNFRLRVRTNEWQQNFLAQSLDVRRAEVAALRRGSAEAIRLKSAEIMDVNPPAVRQILCASGCCRMIHGHTHRPGCEMLDANLGSERWVLSDWDYARGDALEINAQKICRLDWSR